VHYTNTIKHNTLLQLSTDREVRWRYAATHNPINQNPSTDRLVPVGLVGDWLFSTHGIAGTTLL